MRGVAKITLDSRTFQALASSTRLSVLRALDERRKTLSELARDLGLNKATVHEHLQLLTAAELVRKKDEGRKWIYYELTWTGTRILHPQETTTFNLLLSLSALAAGGSFVAMGQAVGWWFQSSSAAMGSDGGEGLAPKAPQGQAGIAASNPSDAGSATSSPSSAQAYSTSATAAPTGTAPAPSPTPHTAAPPHDVWLNGGLLALLLVLVALVVLLGAWFLRRRLRGKRFQAPPGEPEPEERPPGVA